MPSNNNKISNAFYALILVFIACIGVMAHAQAATLVSGAVTTNTSWTLAQSPYQVTADVVIQNGAVLTIEPGVKIGFDAGTNLTIGIGSLNARGTAGQPILFTSSLEVAGGVSNPGDWGQIRFLDGSNDLTTLIENAQIRYGKGISIQAASPTLNYLQLNNNLGAAISIDLASSPKGIGNQATGNTLNGVSVPAGDVSGAVTWGIKGIPYVVAAGVVSVGVSPAISTLNLSEIQQGETLNAVVAGTRLIGAQSVSVSTAGTTGVVQSGATDTSVPIKLTATASATLGSADLALQVAAGRPSLPNALQVIQPQPSITSLNPNSLYTTQVGVVLNVTGNNFVAASVIRLDGVDLTTTYASATSLSAILPAQTAGNKSVTVVQPDPLRSGGFLNSKPSLLTVTIPPLTISPASVSQTQGVPFNLTVSIPFAAPTGGVVVSLLSGATVVATVPASVTIAAGATSVSFPVTTVGVGVVTISASASNFATASVQVQSLVPPTLSIASAKLIDLVGNNFALTITSTNVAGAGGLLVALSSSNAAVAAVPASVTIPAGAKTVNVAVPGIATGTAVITAQVVNFVSGSATLSVRPITQSVSVSPLPVAIPPDNIARKITLKLATVDAIDHTFTVSVADATVAVLGTTSVTIPAGQAMAQVLVSGKKEGSTSISLVSSTLGTVVVPVYVTVEYAGINMSYAAMVGVVKESATPALPPQNISLLSSPNVGVAYGKYITGLSPSLLAIGTGPTTVTINGEGLQAATMVAINPADGLTVGSFSINPDGKSLTVPVTVAANATTTLRQVTVSAGAVPYKPTSLGADRLLISQPVPEVYSVDPLFAVPGNVVTLVVRGKNLQNAQSVKLIPQDGILVGSSPTINADGTELSATLSITAAAARGVRVVQVATPAGSSSGIASASNTFTLVSQVQNTITPIASPVVGLLKEVVVPAPTSQTLGLTSQLLGITKGATVSGVTPLLGAIGNTVAMTITGSELQNVTSVQFNPSTGLTIGTPTLAADGKSLTLNVIVDATAPLGARSIKVLAGTTSLLFSRASDAMFNVILPLANITSVEPIVVPIPATTLTLTLNGSNFQNASEIRITPNTGVTVANPPSINANGTLATVTINVAATAAAGSRMVTVVTPAGESTTLANLGNTVTLTANPGSSYPLVSSIVGLVKVTTALPPVTTPITPFTPIVGVVLEKTLPPPPLVNFSVLQPSPQVGVLFGSAAFALAPEGLLAGSSGTLTITGIGLNAVTSVSVNPSSDITLGALLASPDGTQLNIPVTLGVNAAVGYRWLTLNQTSGLVKFGLPSSNSFWVASALPMLDSVSPNLGQLGTTLSTFTIRGSNLHNATAVVAEPADGITFGVPSVDVTGTVLTVGIVIDAAAPTTARVVRVLAHGARSSAVAVPANTFTVYP